MILNYIQFLLSLFDQGVVKSTVVSLNCETLNVWGLNGDCSLFSEMNLIITEVEKCYKLLSTFSYKKVI